MEAQYPDGTTGKSSDPPSAFLRDQNPAAIVAEVIPLAYSNLKWDGAVRTMVAYISLEHGRRFPLKTNAPNESPPTRQNRLRWALFVYYLDLFIDHLPG